MRLLLIVVVFLAFVGCGKDQPVTKEVYSSGESPGVGLRQLALSSSASKLGFMSDSEFPTVYGVLTDWEIDGIIVTVMSMRDGSASLYTTSTFGIIGGYGHENVRDASTRYVKIAEKFTDFAEPVIEFAYPKSGQVFFYLLTYEGVRLVSGKESAIEKGSDPTWPLFAAAQDVITELRFITENENNQP